MNFTPITERFPSFKEKIGWLIADDEEFREICGHYLVCYYEISRMNQMYAQPLIQFSEYHELLESLGQEIQNYLEGR